MTGPRLLIFGLGYTGTAVARAAAAAGYTVSGTVRAENPCRGQSSDPIHIIDARQAGAAVADTTHLLITAPPGEHGDPLLVRCADVIAATRALRWIGYLSTTGVYGDRGGGWVDEAATPAPGSERARRRVAAETGWAHFADRCAVDVFRLAGIYGPGRSALDELRAGRARRVIRPGHAFSRIHRDDVVRAVLIAIRQARMPGARILNLADDVPAESAAVVEEAARLLGVPPPPAVPFEEAWAAMRPMARSFWAERRLVDNRATKASLGLAWLYPSYREGLRAILEEEVLQRSG